LTTRGNRDASQGPSRFPSRAVGNKVSYSGAFVVLRVGGVARRARHHELRYSAPLYRVAPCVCCSLHPMDVGGPVCGTGVMLSKAVSLVLFVATPVFLSYPAPLNVDPRQMKLPAPLEIWTWVVPSLPATTVVTLKPRWLITQAQLSNGPTLDGDILIKELQRQLRRVGCYSGEVNGVWTQSSRRAMQTFTNRVNARLQVERPDHVLLALLQGHPDKMCNEHCPSGANPAPDGFCVPAAIAGLSSKAAAPPKPEALITSWTAVDTAALEDDIPRLSASKPSRPAEIAVPVKTRPAPKLVAPSKPRMVATRNREPPRSLEPYGRDQSRSSRRANQEPSGRAGQSEFARTMFQRFDSSLR